MKTKFPFRRMICSIPKVMLSLILCFSVLNGPVKAEETTQDCPLWDYVTLNSAAIYQADSSGNPAAKAIADGTEIDPDEPLYLLYRFEIDEDQFSSILAAGQKARGVAIDYTIPAVSGLDFPIPLGSTNLTVNYTDSQDTAKSLTFATLYWDSKQAYLSFNLTGFQTLQADGVNYIDDAYLYLNSHLATDGETPIAGTYNKFKLSFGDDLSLTVYDASKAEKAGKLAKDDGVYDSSDNTFTWTLTLTPWQYSDMGSYQIQDYIDTSKNTLVMGLDGVTPAVVALRDGTVISDVQAVYQSPAENETKGILTIDGLGVTAANQDQPVTITYKTKLADDIFYPVSTNGASSIFKVDNSAQLYGRQNSEAQLAALGSLVSSKGEVSSFKWLTKSGKVSKDGRSIVWTVTVKTNSSPLKTLTLYDVLPEYLSMADTSLNVNGTACAYNWDSETRTFSLDLKNDTVNLLDSTGGATVNYTTVISNTAFVAAAALGNNKASLKYTLPSGTTGTPVNVNVNIGVGSSGAITSLLQKTGSYNAANHTITWKVTVNPYKVDITEAVLTDDMTERGFSYVSGSYKPVSLPKTSTAAVDANTDAKNLIINVSNLGENVFSYTFQTTVDDAEYYAYNSASKTYRNYVNMDYTIDSVTRTTSASGGVSVSSSVIEKTAGLFNYTDHTIIWNMTVNKNKMVMNNAVITDALPAGLSYVTGSLTINGLASEQISISGSDLTITLNDEDCSGRVCTVSFATLVDVDLFPEFREGQSVTFANTATLLRSSATKGAVIHSQPSNTAVKTITANAIAKTGTEHYSEGYIAYTVNINPLNMTHSNVTVKDTTDSGLKIDLDTIDLYEATVDASTGRFTKGNQVDTSSSISYDAVNGVCSIAIPDGNLAYILVYRADIIENKTVYSNHAELAGFSYSQAPSSDSSISVSGGGGGGATAMASRKGAIVISKTDAYSNTAIANAAFTLIREDNGQIAAYGKTDSSGQLTFSGLAIGASMYYTLIETAPVGYQAVSNQRILLSQTAVAGTVRLELTDKAVDTGTLTVSKKLTGSGADLTKKFEFTIVLKDAAGSEIGGMYVYTGQSEGYVKSGDTIELGTDEAITIANLPAGVRYTVTEKDYRAAGYNPDQQTISGLIAKDGDSQAGFVNRYTKPTRMINTGDESDMTMWFIILGVSAAASVVLIVFFIRKKR